MDWRLEESASPHPPHPLNLQVDSYDLATKPTCKSIWRGIETTLHVKELRFVLSNPVLFHHVSLAQWTWNLATEIRSEGHGSFRSAVG